MRRQSDSAPLYCRRPACLISLGMFFAGWGLAASAQVDPASFVEVVPITDNDPATNELGRDRVSINSTAFKNESIITAGGYQFTTNYREDGKLMVMRRELSAPANHWEIRVTEFTSFNINDAHNVPVVGVDGDGYLHLAWGTHADPLLYTRSTTPVTAGEPLAFIGDSVGNSGAINTMTGSQESRTTYPNFIRIPGSDDLLFNYRTGGSGNGVYRINRFDNATDTWDWADEVWINNTDASGLTYNAYPHNLSYDSNGGLHATWTKRYNSSSPTGNSGFQTNHNLYYAYSPDDGQTWFKDLGGQDPYPAIIDESNAEVIVPIPEGSSLINTGTQAIDAGNRPAIATWWAPRSGDPTPDNRRQYMYVGHNGDEWFTSQITHRRTDGVATVVPESQLGRNHMGRPQVFFDDYNRAYVIYKDDDNGGGVTVAVSQAESRDDWEFHRLTTESLGRTEPTVDRTLWQTQRQAHILVQRMDGDSTNGGSPISVLEWDAVTAMGRVVKWSGDEHSTWDTTAANFSHLGDPGTFNSYDNVTFDDTPSVRTVQFGGQVEAAKVVVDTDSTYTFTGAGALTAGSLSVVGGGQLNLETSGNRYAGQTRVANATLNISGDANQMTGAVVVADRGVVVMAASDAATMASPFEVWPTGVLQIGVTGAAGNVFPDNPSAIVNDGRISVLVDETLRNVSGIGAIEVAAGTTTLANNAGFTGTVRILPNATARADSVDGLGGPQASVALVAGGRLHVAEGLAVSHAVSFDGQGHGTIDVSPGSSMTIPAPVSGDGGFIKSGAGVLELRRAGSYAGQTVVRDGQLILDEGAGVGETHVESGGTLRARGTLSGGLTLQGGTLAINSGPSAPLGVLYSEDFAGAGALLNEALPDVSFDSSRWVAAPTFLDNGESLGDAPGGSATLAFTPSDGGVYVLEASIDAIVGDTDWFALGFVNGQSPVNSANSRFITGDVEGLAWAMYRGAQGGSSNQTFLGDTSLSSPGTHDGSPWLVGAGESGGDVDIRITLDTTAGAGAWTATMEADTGDGFRLIRAEEVLNDESINAVGIANSNTRDITGTLTSFSLRELVTPPTPIEQRTLTVAGDATLDVDSTVKMEIAAPGDHDVLSVTGTLVAGGTLEITLPSGGASLHAGDSFDLIDFAARTGAFDRLILPSLAPGLTWDNGQLLTHGVLSIGVGLSGDFNGDMAVDAADYSVWRDNLGATGVGVAGDANRDMRVDRLDYAIWRDQFGATSASSEAVVAPVAPEPTTAVLVLPPAVWMTSRQR
ncbi:MAG: BNR-4 repeat-containing protein [Planctomycetota bacterium]